MNRTQISDLWFQCNSNLYAYTDAIFATLGWQKMDTAPRDGTNILIRFGQDHVSQAKYIPGLPHPWQFIESNNGVSWDINHAVDTKYGPTHWMPMPDVSVKASSATENEISPPLKAENAS